MLDQSHLPRCAARLYGVLAAVTAALLFAPLAALAQGAEDDLTVVLTGRVIDGLTSSPLHGAFVTPAGSDTGFLTDAAGTFHLRVPRSSTAYALEAEQLGYENALFTIAAGNESEPLVLVLEPDPVALEGLHVLSDRFTARRNAAAVSVRAFDRNRLLHAPMMDASEFLRFRAGISVTVCPATVSSSLCVYSRGRRVQPTVYIDETLAFGGLDQLAQYYPHELYLLEVYSHGRMIRAYTEHFMDRHAQRGGRLHPIPLFF